MGSRADTLQLKREMKNLQFVHELEISDIAQKKVDLESTKYAPCSLLGLSATSHLMVIFLGAN